MEGVKVLLDKKTGLFVTESHYAVNIVEELQYDSIYHEHLRFYLLKPLDVLMKMYGFKIIDAVRIPNYGGSIRVIASLNQEIKPSKNELTNIEKIKEPKLPDIVLFGLIFVNFGPLKTLPNRIPPISEDIQINKIIKSIIL